MSDPLNSPFISLVQNGLYTCQICVRPGSDQISMKRSHILKHIKGSNHIRREKEYDEGLRIRGSSAIASFNNENEASTSGPADHILNHMRQHPSSFRLPEEALDIPEEWVYLASTVRKILTVLRGGMKQKIATSMKKKTKKNVYKLSKTLCPSGMEITKAHWARVAFLRKALVDFRVKLQQQDSASTNAKDGTSETVSAEEDEEEDEEERTEEASVTDSSVRIYRSSEFWTYVDDTLASYRKFTQTKYPHSASDRHTAMNGIFTLAVQKDLKTYPLARGARKPKEGALTSWQTTLERSLCWKD